MALIDERVVSARIGRHHQRGAPKPHNAVTTQFSYTSRRTFRFSGRRVENLRSAPRRGPKIWLRRRGGPENLPPAPKIGQKTPKIAKFLPRRSAARTEEGLFQMDISGGGLLRRG